MFRSKKLALALATCGVTGAAIAGTASGALVDESYTVRVPVNVPSFFVGPIDDGDPQTQDMKMGSDSGIRNLEVTVRAAADVRPAVSTVTGGAIGCAADALLNQSLSVTTSRKADVKVIGEWDEVAADGTIVHRIEELLAKTEAGSLTRSVPICVN